MSCLQVEPFRKAQRRVQEMDRNHKEALRLLSEVSEAPRSREGEQEIGLEQRPFTLEGECFSRIADQEAANCASSEGFSQKKRQRAEGRKLNDAFRSVFQEADFLGEQALRLLP